MASCSLRKPTPKAEKGGFVLDPESLWFDPKERRIYSKYHYVHSPLTQFHSIVVDGSKERLFFRRKEQKNSCEIHVFLVSEREKGSVPFFKEEDVVNWLVRVRESSGEKRNFRWFLFFNKIFLLVTMFGFFYTMFGLLFLLFGYMVKVDEKETGKSKQMIFEGFLTTMLFGLSTCVMMLRDEMVKIRNTMNKKLI